MWVPSRSRVHKAPSPSTGPPSAEGENQTPSTPSTSTGTLGRHRPRIHPSRPQRSTKASSGCWHQHIHANSTRQDCLPEGPLTDIQDRRQGTPHGHTRHIHIRTGHSERSMATRTPANARPQPHPDPHSLPDTTYHGCRACSRCSIGDLLTGKPSTNFIDAPWVCTHASTPGADTSSAIVSAGKGPQETLDWKSEIRTWGGAGADGSAELLAGSSGGG